MSTLLFRDTFHTDPNPDGDGWFDINHAIAARQSGLVAPRPYLERDATASGGAADYLTQVNNPGLPNTLLLADQPASGQNNTYVSPNQDFGAPGLEVQNLHVAINPLGPGSSPSTDHWAALVFGTMPGASITGTGTGVLVRDTGMYALWDRGTQVSTGNVGAKRDPGQFYTIDFTVIPATSQFTLAIDGQPLFTGTHGLYTSNYVTLENHTQPTDTGIQLDYFADFSIHGVVRHGPLTATPNTTYYVSPQGHDGNPGTSPATAWRTIDHVNRVNFRPGDQILFQGGATFPGHLAFDSQDLGTVAAPIMVGSYGTDPATIDAGNDTGISVVDAAHFTITNLRVVGSGYATNGGDGIDFTVDLPGVTLAGISINDVDVGGFGQVGIHITGVNSTGDYHDIAVTYASTHDNGYGGLEINAQRNPTEVYVGHVQTYHNAGAGITQSGFGMFISGASDVVVERSVASDNGWLPGNAGLTGGIEAIGSQRVLLQHNEAYANHRGGADGDGIILDDTTDSIMQFNYAHDNDGAGLFLGAENGRAATNNVIRYNVGENDARAQSSAYGGIFVWQDISNADIDNNTVFMGPSPASSPAAIRFTGLSGTSVHVRDNLFVTTGGVPLVTYSGGGTDLLLQGNDYWPSGSAFAIQWLGTTFQSLHSWRMTTGQERLGGHAVGYRVDPQLVNPGGGGIIGNADLLDTLTAYQLRATSLVGHAGLNLNQLGIAWDAYGFAGDAFLSLFFDPMARDFYGDLLPAAGFSIGADQLQ